MYMTDFFFICSMKFSQCTDKNSKPRDQNQETGNDCDVISGLEALRKTGFSDIFLFSYKQCTFVPFLSEFISSESENVGEICFLQSFKS